MNAMKRKIALLCFTIGTHAATGQVNTFEKLQQQLTAPTETYEVIKQGADSLITAWHAANPNSTDYAPSEKAYLRWDMLAHSRHYIIGQPQVGINNLKTQAANLQLNYSYCTNGPTENPWQSLGPVQDSGQPQAVGLVSAIAVHPTDEDIIYAGGGECSGLFKTTDGGATWTNITDVLGYPGLAIGAIAIDPANPDHILVGTASTAWGYFENDFANQGYGIIRSTNGGQTWTNVSPTTAFGADMRVSAIRYTPGNSNNVWATTAREIWKSTDNGATWTVALPDTAVSPDNFFIDLEIAPGNANSICASTIFVGQVNPTHGSAKVYCSDDGGLNFFTDSLPNLYVPPFNTIKPLRATRAVALAVTASKPNTIFAFFANSVDTGDCTSPGSYLYKTTSGGRNWTLIQGEAINAISNIAATGAGHWGRYRYQFELSDTIAPYPVIYVGGDVLLRRNLNQIGHTWQSRSKYVPTPSNNTHADIRGIVNRGNGATGDKLFIANDGGISKTTNSGKTWANLNGAGLAITEFHGFASWKNSEDLYGGAMHNAWAHFNGGSWKLFSGFTADGGYVLGHPELTNTGYSACGGLTNSPIFRFSLNPGSGLPFINPGNSPLWAKFDITKTAPYILYWGVDKWGAGNKNDLLQYNESTGIQSVAFDNNTFDSPEPVSVVKVAPSNPNILYMAFAGQPWTSSPVGKIWTRKNNGSWMDLSQNIFIQNNGVNTSTHALQYMFITDIAVDPLDPNRVWVGMSYYDPDAKNRVFFSSDGGLSWNDVSQGLPIFSINCLTYQEGSDDVIYAGTDGGVYYWDKPNNTWQCFNNGLPPAIVTKIDVHPCKGVLYASTYGRGMWQAPIIFSNGPAEPIAVNTTIPAGTTQIFEKDLAVQPGVTLTIQGTAQFSSGKRLIILPNAKVIVDGGTLTNNAACGNNWEGIEVRGTANMPQTPTHQGVLITKQRGTTAAVISNARTAITNAGWGGTDFLWGTQGGIIECANTTFLNNRRDVQLISYHDVLSNGYEKDYKADFTHCTFTRDASFAQGDITASVSMWDVVGPIFSGCTFDVQNMAYTGPVDKKQGLYTIAAAYRLTNSPTNTGNTFTGYYKAIESKLMKRADKFITVKNTTFTNNLFGAHLETTSNARVLFNTFNVPGGSGLNPTINFSYGLYFDYSTGYTCTENHFEKPFGSSGQAAGVVLKGSGADYNLVYRNSFTRLTYGSQALDTNRSASGLTGLEYKCNDFGNPSSGTLPKNATDVLVALSALVPDPNNQDEYGIQVNQGRFVQGQSQPEDLANNLFSQDIGFNYNLNNAPGTIKFYYFYDGNATARMEPRYNVALASPTYLQVVNFDPGVVASYNLHCLPNVTEYGSPGKTVADLQTTLSNADAVVQSKRTLYTQLLNGGNTPELEAEILFASQPDYIGLYLDLLSISPFVDVPQILDLINKNDFPEMALRNLILANPHSGRDPEVWEALITRNPALSQQTLNDIRNGRATRTTKDVLEAEIGFYSGNAQRSVNDLLYYYADSSYADTDSLKHLLQSRSEFTYVLQLAEYYLTSGQYTALQNMWGSLNTEWYSEGDLMELPHWQSLYNTLRNAFAAGQRYATLSSTTLNSLQSLANQAQGAVKHHANTILRSYGMGTPYIEPMSFYAGNSNKQEEIVQRPTKPAATFTIYPNPAKDYFELRWNWFEQGINTDMRIVVKNLIGAQIMQQNIKDYKNNITVVAANTLQPGIYLIEIQTNDGNILFVEKVTVIK